MSLLRAFIAVEIPPDIHKEIESQTAPLRVALGTSLVRWTPVTNIHLTLKFLGDISPSNAKTLAQLLTNEASQHPAFEIQFRELGVFPNSKQPHVLWIGIQAPVVLAALQHAMEAITAKLGYPVEKRPFSPHLTIGRVKQNLSPAELQRIRTALEETSIDIPGSARISAVHLFKSQLKPTGAVYTCLHSAPLQSY